MPSSSTPTTNVSSVRSGALFQPVSAISAAVSSCSHRHPNAGMKDRRGSRAGNRGWETSRTSLFHGNLHLAQHSLNCNLMLPLHLKKPFTAPSVLVKHTVIYLYRHTNLIVPCEIEFYTGVQVLSPAGYT